MKDYIGNTMLGIEYLWGRPVQLETSEVFSRPTGPNGVPTGSLPETSPKEDVTWQRVRYTMKDRKLSWTVIR